MLLLGAVLHWRLAMAVPAILTLPTMAALANLRESPSWLQRQGRNEGTRSSRLLQNLTASRSHIGKTVVPRGEGNQEGFVGEAEGHLENRHPAGLRLLVQLCLPGHPLPPPRLVWLLHPLVLCR